MNDITIAKNRHAQGLRLGGLVSSLCEAKRSSWEGSGGSSLVSCLSGEFPFVRLSTNSMPVPMNSAVPVRK